MVRFEVSSRGVASCTAHVLMYIPIYWWSLLPLYSPSGTSVSYASSGGSYCSPAGPPKPWAFTQNLSMYTPPFSCKGITSPLASSTMYDPDAAKTTLLPACTHLCTLKRALFTSQTWGFICRATPVSDTAMYFFLAQGWNEGSIGNFVLDTHLLGFSFHCFDSIQHVTRNYSLAGA